MNKKRKVDINLYEQIFEEHLNDEKDYSNTQVICEKVKSGYLEKISEGKLDIGIERTRLECYLSKETSPSLSYIINFIILSTAILANGIITAYTQYIDYYDSYVLIIGAATIFMLTVFGLAFWFGKDSIKKEHQRAVYIICLKTLNDIEKQIEDSSNSLKQEAAATTENQAKDLVKNISNSNNNGNWNISISETSILAMAKGVYGTAKFVGKLFRKKKNK